MLISEVCEFDAETHSGENVHDRAGKPQAFIQRRSEFENNFFTFVNHNDRIDVAAAKTDLAYYCLDLSGG